MISLKNIKARLDAVDASAFKTNAALQTHLRGKATNNTNLFAGQPPSYYDCGGTCVWTCSSCSGGCSGSASGTCGASCSSTCTSSCTSTCTGSCSGGCGASCSSSCSGTCSGSCSGGCGGLVPAGARVTVVGRGLDKETANGFVEKRS